MVLVCSWHTETPRVFPHNPQSYQPVNIFCPRESLLHPLTESKPVTMILKCGARNLH